MKTRLAVPAENPAGGWAGSCPSAPAGAAAPGGPRRTFRRTATRRSTNVIRLCVSLASLALGAPAWAGDTPLYAPPPDWIRPVAALPAGTAADAPLFTVVDVQQRIVDGQVWDYRDAVLRVASAELLNQAGTLKFIWQPADGDLVVHRIEIVRGDQHIDQLAQGRKLTVIRREQGLEQQSLDGMLTATLAIEGLRIGDTIRTVVSTTRKDRALGGNAQTLSALIAAPARVGFGRMILSWPEKQSVRWRTYTTSPVPAERLVKGFREVEVTMPVAKVPEMPANSPARFRIPPLIEASTFADWAAVSRTMAPLYEVRGTIAPGSPLAAEVARIAGATPDPVRRAQAALRLVQDQVRYLFAGMDGGNYLPQSPARTWELRYGDCKAKTLLLLAMLNDLGVDAEPVLANLGAGDVVPTRLPAPAAFNHVLVRASIAAKSYWLDGTGRGTRAEDFSDVPPLRYALPVRAQGASLEPVAARAPARPQIETTLEYDHRAALKLPTLFKASLQLRGSEAADAGVLWAQLGSEQRAEFGQRAIADFFDTPLVSEVSLSSTPDQDEAVLTVSGLVTSLWRRSDGRLRIDLDRTISAIAFDADRARQAWQAIPVDVGFPYHRVVATRVLLPPHEGAFTLEGDTKLDDTIAGAHVVRAATVDDTAVTVRDTIAQPGAEIAAADLPAVRSRLAAAKTHLLTGVAPAAYPARWKEVLAARKAGTLAPILATYAKAIALFPDNAVGYRARSSFNAGIFEWRAAILDYDRAIAIEPTAASYLARSELHTIVGQDARALEDALAALALEPASSNATDVAIELHAALKQYDAALALADERIAAGGDDKSRFLQAKADTLAAMGRMEEAIAASDQAVALGRNNPSLLNGRCWLKARYKIALESAVADCTKAIELDDSPAAELDSRAMVYMQMGRLDDALADLNAALDLTPDLGSTTFLRGVVRSKLRQAGAQEDLTGGRLMSPQTEKTYAKFGVAP